MIEALEGTIARLVSDPDLVQLVGALPDGEPRIVAGWPWQMLERDPEEMAVELPLVSVLQVTDVIRRPGIGHVQLQIDPWAWPVGEGGGLRRLYAIDQCILDRLDEAHWIHQGVQLYAISEPAVDFPAGPDEPLRRSRTFEVRYSRTL
jgi:hypothetical protein